MQTRLLIAAAAVLVALGFFVWWTEDDEPGEDGEPQEERLFPDLDASDVLRLVAGAPGEELRLAREGESDWTVGADPPRPADDALAEAAARAASTLSSSREIPVDGASLADFGLGDDAFAVSFETAAGDTFEFRVGDKPPVGSGRYILIPTTGKVHVVDGWSISSIEKDPADFRDRRLLPLEQDGIVHLSIEPDGREPLALARDGRHWFYAGEPAWRAETDKVRDLLVELIDLRAREFLDAGQLAAEYPAQETADDPGEAAGEGTPEEPVAEGGEHAEENAADGEPGRANAGPVAFVLRDADGNEARLDLGAVGALGTRVARLSGTLLAGSGGDAGARVEADFLDDLDLAQDSWRAVALLDFNPWIVDAVEWSAGGQTWQLARKDGGWVRRSADGDLPIDADAVQDLLVDLDSLRSAAYAPPDLEASEAGVQQARISLTLSDGGTEGLSLYRGVNRDMVQVDGEPGLREVGAEVHALLGHLRPLDAPPGDAAEPGGQDEPPGDESQP